MYNVNAFLHNFLVCFFLNCANKYLPILFICTTFLRVFLSRIFFLFLALYLKFPRGLTQLVSSPLNKQKNSVDTKCCINCHKSQGKYYRGVNARLTKKKASQQLVCKAWNILLLFRLIKVLFWNLPFTHFCIIYINSYLNNRRHKKLAKCHIFSH